MDSHDTEVKKVSTKSTKNEILSAYEELARKLQENAESAEERKTDMETKHHEELRDKASKHTVDAILKSIAELEVSARKWLGDLAQALAKELEKLKNLEEVITGEKKYLETIHRIKVEADTLAQLIQASKDKKKQLEEEYKQLEEDLERKKTVQREAWQREEEEYEYELYLKRRKEEADYEEKKVAKERMLKEREEKLAAAERELQELRKFREEAEKNLDITVNRVREETEKETRKEEEIRAKILGERVAAEKHIAELTIATLQKELTTKEEAIRQLKHELDIANRGVKDIAMKVIESGRNDQHRSIRDMEYEKKTKDERINT